MYAGETRTDFLGSPGFSWGIPGNQLGSPWGPLRTSWESHWKLLESPGGHFGQFREPPGIWGTPERLLGSLWGILANSSAHIGPVLLYPGELLGSPGTLLGFLREPLGFSWKALGITCGGRLEGGMRSGHGRSRSLKSMKHHKNMVQEGIDTKS